jgi:DNA repair exonuclease SbcCD nuclease subunit
MLKRVAMKIIYTTDWHLCSKCPGKRKEDDFFKLEMAKVDEIVNFAIQNNIDLIIHGGDFFDSPKIDYWLLNIMISKFQKLNDYHIPVLLVPGSHDMYGYNVDSLKSTAVGALVETGLIKILNGKKQIGDRVFYGMPATLTHTLEMYANIEPKSVVVSHNMITPISVPYSHILLQTIPNLGSIFLTGHYHRYLMCRSNDNVFINTGPLIRTDITECDNKPCIIFMDFSDKVAIKKIELINVKRDVFNTDSEQAPINFVNSLQTTKFVFCDIFDLTKQVSKSLNVSDDITSEAISRLEKVQREIS